MTVPKAITDLLERYNAQREAYESGQYKRRRSGSSSLTRSSRPLAGMFTTSKDMPRLTRT